MIKIPEGKKYTNDEVKLACVNYFKQRVDYYQKNFDKYEKQYKNCFPRWRRSIR